MGEVYLPPIPYGLSKAKSGDLKEALQKHFGSSAIGSKPHHLGSINSLHVVALVDGKIWTTEDVFWQNQLTNRLVYPVIYRCFELLQLANIYIEKPWFFQRSLKEDDIASKIVWDTPTLRAPWISPGTPPKIKLIFGPARCRYREAHLQLGKGTNWGFQHFDLSEEEKFEIWRGSDSYGAIDPENNYVKPLPLDFPNSSDPDFYP